jgi:hypothetical protein
MSIQVFYQDTTDGPYNPVLNTNRAIPKLFGNGKCCQSAPITPDTNNCDPDIEIKYIFDQLESKACCDSICYIPVDSNNKPTDPPVNNPTDPPSGSPTNQPKDESKSPDSPSGNSDKNSISIWVWLVIIGLIIIVVLSVSAFVYFGMKKDESADDEEKNEKSENNSNLSLSYI